MNGWRGIRRTDMHTENPSILLTVDIVHDSVDCMRLAFLSLAVRHSLPFQAVCCIFGAPSIFLNQTENCLVAGYNKSPWWPTGDSGCILT